MLGWSKAALGFEGMLDAEAGEGSSAGQRFSKDLCPQGSVGFEANASDVNTHGLKAVLGVRSVCFSKSPDPRVLWWRLNFYRE